MEATKYQSNICPTKIIRVHSVDDDGGVWVTGYEPNGFSKLHPSALAGQPIKGRCKLGYVEQFYAIA